MESRSTNLRRVTAAEARSLLEEHEQSGLSVAAFARDRGIDPWPLYGARAVARQRARKTKKERFARVAVVNKAPSLATEDSAIEMSLPSGLTLRVSAGFDEVTLRRLLGVLATC